MRSRATPADAWFVYVLRCGDGTLYTGIARDVVARMTQHEAGRGARYTRGRGPFELLGKVRCKGQGDALRLEAAIKALPREAKLAVAARMRTRAPRVCRSIEQLVVRRSEKPSNSRAMRA